MERAEADYKHGVTIIKQGDVGDGFYILLSGAVEVYKDDMLLTVLMYPGTIFGEMADILGKPRTCTVKVKNQARLAHVRGAGIDKVIREDPDLALKIIKSLASRLERTTQKFTEKFKESPLWTVEGPKKP